MWPPDVCCKSSWADTQKLPPSCGAEQVRALYVKQAQQCGATTWDVADPADDEPHRDAKYSRLRVFIFTSDAGADQKASRKIMDGETRDSLFLVLLHQFCVLHVLALIVKKQLQRFGANYWSTLAKAVNTWRTLGPRVDCMVAVLAVGNQLCQLCQLVGYFTVGGPSDRVLRDC